MNCENCNGEHDGNYGSGRFCSSKCARGFSTKAKRNEINRKVSIKLKKEAYCKKCSSCHKSFYTKRKKQKYCSHRCSGAQGGKNIVNKENLGGYRKNGGKSKQYEYFNKKGHLMKLNQHEIKVAKALDSLNINWVRNHKGFTYIDLVGKKRKFHPDFYTEDFNLYIEYKGWVNKELNHKMDDAVKRNDLKLLIIYSNDKRYKDLGLSLNEIIKNPNLILENI